MPGQTQRPRRFVPAGLSDASDGSEAFPGACEKLVNLIPQPNARGVFVPRPAMVSLTALPDWSGGPVLKLVGFGDIFYGLYASVSFAGRDIPFCYDAAHNAFTPISGMTTANLPLSQPTTGDWQPPTIAQVAGRVLFTHPGFPGGTGFGTKFGWLDISGFSATVTADSTAGSANLANVNVTGIQPGMTISGASLPVGTLVLRVDTIGNNILASQNATTTTPGGSYAVAGGSASNPLWGAGDMSVFPLAGSAPAVFVAQYNNRAWFGVNAPGTAAVQASDAGSACVQTNISQTLQFNNGIPVSAAAGLPLSNQLGGIIQSLMVFQGDSTIQQITGDFIYNNISVNALQVATGTLSPDSIAATPRGLLFAASDGIRLIGSDGSVTDPIGSEGQGLSLPFTNAVTPSRTHAAFNENVYRMTITWSPPTGAAVEWGSAQRTDEFWFHLSEIGRPLSQSRWSGPHSSLLDAAAPWLAYSSFLVAPQAARGTLTRSDPRPVTGTIYTEFGTSLSCDLKTLLLPDNPQQNAVEVIETTVWIGYDSRQGEVLASAIDDVGQTLDQTYVWLGPFSNPGQRPLPWHRPLVFRQMRLELRAQAIPQLQFGAINIRDEMLNYQLSYPVPAQFALGTATLGGPGVLGA